MVTVTGNLNTILGPEAIGGSLEVALCGYGSRIPRLNAVALMARVDDGRDGRIPVGAAGLFSFTVAPNDEYAPAGTYYTITVRDTNGDVVQINAYRFTSDQGTWDLNLLDPFDPNDPPPPLPPIIINQLLIVPDDSPEFDGADYTAWKMDLTQDVLTATLNNLVPGNLYTFILVQDAAGGHLFQWPMYLHNGCYVDPRPNVTTVQTFVADENFNLWAIGPGTSVL